MKRRQIAWILILIVDVAYVAWGAMAAAMPDGLAGPGGKAILPAGYEGYSGSSWSELLRTSPMTAKYMIVLFGRTASTAWSSGCWEVRSLSRPSGVAIVGPGGRCSSATPSRWRRP